MKKLLIALVFFNSYILSMKPELKSESSFINPEAICSPAPSKPSQSDHPAALAPANGACYFSRLPGDLKRKIMIELCQGHDSLKGALRTIHRYQMINRECLNLLKHTTETNRDSVLCPIVTHLACRWLGNDFDDVVRIWKQRNKPLNPDAPLAETPLLIYQSLKRIRHKYQPLKEIFNNPEYPGAPAIFKRCFEEGFPVAHLIQTALNTDDAEEQQEAFYFMDSIGVPDECIILEKKYLEFRRAILDHDYDSVETFIQSGIDVERPILAWTPLMWASKFRAGPIISRLIDAGASVNQGALRGETPLSVATGEVFPEIVQLLIQAGARVNHCNRYGETPLMMAALFDAEANEGPHNDAAHDDEEQEEGNREYDRARALKHTVQLLLAAKADVNRQDNRKLTALMIAVNSGNHQMVQQLFQAGADPSIRNIEGETALDIATKTKDQYLIELLRQTEKKIKSQNESTLRTRTSCHKRTVHSDDEQSESDSESEEASDTDSVISDESTESEASVISNTTDESENTNESLDEDASDEDESENASESLDEDVSEADDEDDADEEESHESEESESDYSSRPTKRRR